MINLLIYTYYLSLDVTAVLSRAKLLQDSEFLNKQLHMMIIYNVELILDHTS